MSNDILKYYEEYNKSGHYSLNWFKGSSRHLLIEEWLRSNLKSGAKVLDVGCGDGSYAEWIPEFEWTGIDIGAPRTSYKGTHIVGNVEVFPYSVDSASQDAVVCSEVLEHLWGPENVHKEVYRVLKPGGIYILSTPNFNWIEHTLKSYSQVLYAPKQASHTKEHIRFYDLSTHLSMLQEAGFSPKDFCGADAQWGDFFQQARWELKNTMSHLSDGEVDLFLGKMFRLYCHTIAVLAVKP